MSRRAQFVLKNEMIIKKAEHFIHTSVLTSIPSEWNVSCERFNLARDVSVTLDFQTREFPYDNDLTTDLSTLHLCARVWFRAFSRVRKIVIEYLFL